MILSSRGQGSAVGWQDWAALEAVGEPPGPASCSPRGCRTLG